MAKRAELRRKARSKPQESNTTIWMVGGIVVFAIIAIAALLLTRTPGSTGSTTTTTQNIPNPDIPRIGLAEARGKLGQSGVVFVDVRANQEFTQSHVQGAINIPLPEVVNRLAELPRDAEIITYCT